MRSTVYRRARTVIIATLGLAALGTFRTAAQQPPPTPAIHAKAARRLVIRNAMVIYGNAKPPYGPVDIVVQDGLISYIGASSDLSSAGLSSSSDTVIDATGKYVMPGIVNTHMHWHEERQPGVPQPIQYERNLYLAAGVTTAREVGGDFDKSKRWQAESNAHHDRRTAHPGLPVREQGADGIARRDPHVDPRHQAARGGRPEDHRDGSRSARSDHGRSAQAQDAHGHAHRRGRDHGEGLHRARRQLDRALLRRGGRGAERHPELPARDELLERDPPLRPRGRALRAGGIPRSCTRSST